MIRRKRNPGWFKKGGKAKRRKSTRRRLRRRSNPHLLLANPSSAGQLNLFGPTGAKIDPVLIRTIREGAMASKKKKRKSSKPKRRSRKAAAAVTRRRPRASTAPRRRGRKYYRIYRGRGRSPKYRIFRRSNPFGGILGYARIAAFGGLGVVAARIGGRLYSDHLGKTVAGADPQSFRAILNEGLRVFAMGAFPIMVSRYALRRLPIVTGADAMAFELGGLAEAGRQGIGVVLKRVRPALDRGKWGLDGMGAFDEVRDDGQQLYGRSGQQWYVIGYSNGAALAGLEEAGSFGGLVERDGFGDYEVEEDGDIVDTM